MKVDKRILVMGAGAGVGAIVSPVLKKWVEPMIGSQIPGLDALGVWGTWHVFVPVVSGGVLLAVTMFTDVISRGGKHQFINDGLAMYGFAALVSGVVTGVIEMQGLGARARAAPAMATNRVVRASPQMNMTPTGISGKTIIA